MAMNSYYKQQYKCSSCKTVQKHYVWSSDIETKTHTCEKEGCGATLTVEDLHDEPEVNAPAVMIKMTSPQIKADRRKRNHKHFKNEVLPSITDPDARKHHLNKIGKKS